MKEKWEFTKERPLPSRGFINARHSVQPDKIAEDLNLEENHSVLDLQDEVHEVDIWVEVQEYNNQTESGEIPHKEIREVDMGVEVPEEEAEILLQAEQLADNLNTQLEKKWEARSTSTDPRWGTLDGHLDMILRNVLKGDVKRKVNNIHPVQGILWCKDTDWEVNTRSRAK